MNEMAQLFRRLMIFAILLLTVFAVATTLRNAVRKADASLRNTFQPQR